MIPDELKRMTPLKGKERLGADRDSEYMGAEDIDPETEPVLTIKALYNGMVTLSRGKEKKDVIVFAEETVPGIKTVRPLIVNATNRKTLRKLYKNVTADTLMGKKVQLYLEHNVRDPSTGDKVDGVRIKNRIPTAQNSGNAPILCADCGQTITAVGTYSAADIAQINEKRFGRKLCAACSKKLAEQAKQEQPKPEESVAEEPKPQSSLAESLMEE